MAVYIWISATLACGSSPTAPSPQPPNLLGQWTGGYTLSSCQETGAASGSGFCAQLGSGSVLVFTPQQTGSTLSGNLSIGAFSPIPVTGTVGTDTVVALSGSGPIQLGASLALTQFRGTVNGSISGTLQYTITTSVPIGSATVAGSFQLTR
jgi:hypothetical protein